MAFVALSLGCKGSIGTGGFSGAGRIEREGVEEGFGGGTKGDNGEKVVSMSTFLSSAAASSKS